MPDSESILKLTCPPADEKLKKEIDEVLLLWKMPSDIGEQLSAIILAQVKLRHENEYLRKDAPTGKEHATKIDDFLDSLRKTRKAWLGLPARTREICLEYINTESSLLPSEITSLLSSMTYNQKELLPEWRLEGLSNISWWSYELEMFDLIQESVEIWRDRYVIKLGRNDQSHINLVTGLIDIFHRFGLKTSYAERSRFTKLIRVIFPNLTDPKAIIKKAIDKANSRPYVDRRLERH